MLAVSVAQMHSSLLQDLVFVITSFTENNTIYPWSSRPAIDIYPVIYDLLTGLDASRSVMTMIVVMSAKSIS